jgi:glyoxylase-like metal-dependent hydrolase (beta-lactamase superfamily II)
MKVHIIKGYIQNIYLVEYSHGLLLLDSGCYCDFPIIKTFIESNLNRKISELKLVLVSHTHPDHIGGAWRFKKAGIPIACFKDMDQWYLRKNGLRNYWVDILLTWYVARKMKRPIKNIFFKRRVNAEYLLEDGDKIPFFEDWKALHTPGHTDSDLTFIHEESGKAYIGDNIIKLRDNFIIPHPISFPDRYKESLARYKDLSIKEFLLAHGGETSISNESIDDILSRVKPHVIDNSHILKQVLGNLRKKR